MTARRLYTLTILTALVLLVPLFVAWAAGGVYVHRPLALVTLLALWYWPWATARSLAGETPTVRQTALIMRTALSIFLTVVLCDVRLVKGDNTLTVIFVVDHSASIPERAKEDALAYVNAAAARLPAGDRAGLVVFGENASVEIVPSLDLRVDRLYAAVRPDFTNVEQALDLATAAFPGAGRRKIVLLTDGNENAGSMTEAAASLAAAGVAFDVLPIRRDSAPEIMIDNLALPEEVRDGESFEVRARILARSAGPAEVAILTNGRAVARRTVDLVAGVNPVQFTTSVEGTGFHNVTVRVAGEADTLEGNNAYTGAVFVRGAARLLLVAPTPQETAALAAACQQTGRTVVQVTPDDVPRTPVDLYGYDCVVVANCPASAFSAEFLIRLEMGVRELGMGLIMTGGEDSFAAGGWDGSAIARALPVGMQPNRKRKLPKGALVMLLHTCEFADGNYWGKEISKASLRTLSADDEAGVLYFSADQNETWLFPLTSMREEPYMRQLIDACEPGDMISFAPAFGLAREALLATDAVSRHMIVISDGDPSEPKASDIRALSSAKITVSMVAINPHPNQPRDIALMKRIAKQTGGKFYLVDDPRSLPAVFIREARRVQRGTIIRESFRPNLAAATPFTEPLVGRTLPLLYGRVAVSQNEGATIDMTAPDEFEDPVLAHWQYGLGRTVAFASDAGASWGREWVRWDEGVRMWQSLVDWAARPARSDDLTLSTSVDGDRGSIVVDALTSDGRYRNNLVIKATVAAEEEIRPLVMSRSAPGRYRGDFPLLGVGVNMITLSWRDPETGASGLASTALSVPYPPEYRVFSANMPLLHEAAAAAGGQILTGDPARDPIFAAEVPALQQPLLLYGIIAAIAAALFFIEALIRRLVVRRQDLSVLAETIKEKGTRPVRGDAEVESGLAELRRRRASVPVASPKENMAEWAEDQAEPELQTEVLKAPETAALASTSTPRKEKKRPPADESGEGGGYTSKLLAAKKHRMTSDRIPKDTGDDDE
jgi:Mg-chelatase subunit ChlD